MDGTKACWASLPRELQLHILEHLATAHGSPTSPRRGIARFASVSKDWQDFFEETTFKNFVLRLPDLIPFRQHTQSPRRRGYVRHIWLRLVEPDPEDEDPAIPWNQSRSHFGPATLYLWDTLASWGVQESREGLTLEISSHTLAGLSTYANCMPKDDVNHYSKHLETGTLAQYDDVEPFGHTGPLWFTHIGQSTSMLSGAVQALFSYDIRLSRIRLPHVEVVTKLLTRRANTRNLHPDSLDQIMKSLPRLKEIHVERWRLRSEYEERRWLKGLNDICRDGFPASVKKFAILHEASNTPYFSRIFRRGVKVDRGELVGSVVQGCLLLEHLALCFIVDADEFLNNAPGFPELKTLTLTAEVFRSESHDSDVEIERRIKIKTLLLLAALAACRMSKLELMEIWNGRNGQASLFRYKVSTVLAEITWKSTHGDAIVDDDVVKAWEATARVHGRSDLRSSVTRLEDDRYRYYGSLLPHLESKEHFIHEVSAAQMK
ncbi:hypothetical protein CSAL01_05193 [Colletotrichum salicis]|uniref:DUF6546 domain-containing protein n=1 Tax=Colletotrichum salicis TaxID=1209931 RepID=A0A135T5I7_9PEZI|nr:hypothetical protein CSAL01_05193 [Colletotrichum salicis]